MVTPDGPNSFHSHAAEQYHNVYVAKKYESHWKQFSEKLLNDSLLFSPVYPHLSFTLLKLSFILAIASDSLISISPSMSQRIPNH